MTLSFLALALLAGQPSNVPEKASGLVLRLEEVGPLPAGCVIASEFASDDVDFGPVLCDGRFFGEIRAAAGDRQFRIVTAGKRWRYHAIKELPYDGTAQIWLRTELSDTSHAIVLLDLKREGASFGPIDVRVQVKKALRVDESRLDSLYDP